MAIRSGRRVKYHVFVHYLVMSVIRFGEPRYFLDDKCNGRLQESVRGYLHIAKFRLQGYGSSLVPLDFLVRIDELFYCYSTKAVVVCRGAHVEHWLVFDRSIIVRRVVNPEFDG